ncbi:hypothetical protein TNCV_3391981 [Trichonephila clavipes]|nr:hypothetical protein TNCV_3391981 [Trichonephila clavipes]
MSDPAAGVCPIHPFTYRSTEMPWSPIMNHHASPFINHHLPYFSRKLWIVQRILVIVQNSKPPPMETVQAGKRFYKGRLTVANGGQEMESHHSGPIRTLIDFAPRRVASCSTVPIGPTTY